MDLYKFTLLRQTPKFETGFDICSHGKIKVKILKSMDFAIDSETLPFLPKTNETILKVI